MSRYRDFRWVTHDQREFRPRDMVNSHLFNAIKMIYNNIVPPAFRVGDFVRWDLSKRFSVDYIEEAIYELTTELQSRPEYVPHFKNAIDDMEANLAILDKIEAHGTYLTIAI